MHASFDDTKGMDPPGAETLGVEAGDIGYAALLDRHAAAEPITDEMVRRASQRHDSTPSRPFASAARERSATASTTLARLFRVSR